MRTRRKAARFYPYLWLGSACVFCLLPLALVAGKFWRGANLGNWYRLQLDCAAVFTHYNGVWSQPATLVRRGDGAWEQVDHALLTPMPIAGYRYRWDRMTWEADRRRVSLFWPRAAQFVAERLDTAGRDPVTEVRVLKVLQRSTDPEAISPTGNWSPAPYVELRKGQYVEIMHCIQRGQAWVTVPKRGKAPVAKVDGGSTAGSKRPLPATTGGPAGAASKGAAPKRRVLPLPGGAPSPNTESK